MYAIAANKNQKIMYRRLKTLSIIVSNENLLSDS